MVDRKKGRGFPGLLHFCLISTVDRAPQEVPLGCSNQPFLWLASRIQVATTVSGFNEGEHMGR